MYFTESFQSKVDGDDDDEDEDSDEMWQDSSDESSSDEDVPAIGYTAAYFLKK